MHTIKYLAALLYIYAASLINFYIPHGEPRFQAEDAVRREVRSSFKRCAKHDFGASFHKHYIIFYCYYKSVVSNLS